MSKADDIFWRQFGTILVGLTVFGIVVFFIARSIAGDAFDRQTNAPSAVEERIRPAGQLRIGDPSAVVAAAPAPAPAAAAAPAVPTATAAGGGEAVYNKACVACHATGAAGAPKLTDAAAWAPRLEQGADALVASVVNGKGAMPPKGGNPALTEDEIRDAVAYMTEQAGGGAPAAEQAAPAAAQTEEPAKEAAAAPAAAAPAAQAGKPGADVYNMGCVACHATGAANAPKLTDKAAWEPRVGAGFAALVQAVLNGKGAMPPKGGVMTLTDADVENAVRYMLEQAGVDAGG